MERKRVPTTKGESGMEMGTGTGQRVRDTQEQTQRSLVHH